MKKRDKKIKVLIAKVGMDTHDKGAKIVAKACKDAGMEVIYLGAGIETAEQIIQAAVQDDVDVIGLSSLSGGHLKFCEKICSKIKDKMVIVGGVIPPSHRLMLRDKGVAEVFPTGTPTWKIIDFIHGRFRPVLAPVVHGAVQREVS